MVIMKSDRIHNFEALSNHPWLGRVYSRLSDSDLRLAREFMEANGDLAKGDFEFAINRMFMDRERPKRYKEILELLCCANSAL